MGDDIHIEQVWHHIEDQLRPSFSRKVRQVMDVYTCNKHLAIDLDEDGLSNLQIVRRDLSQDLPFIYTNKKLYVNLGDPANWPNEMSIDNKSGNRKHIKIELKYRESPALNKNFVNGYTSDFTIKWPIRPEFYITVPLGMEIDTKGKNLNVSLIIDLKKKIKKDMYMIN